MIYQLKVDYTFGTEIYDLTLEEQTEVMCGPNRFDLNAMLRIAKKRRFFDKEKTGDIKC